MRLNLTFDDAIPPGPEVVDERIISHAAARARATREIDRTRSGFAVSLVLPPRPDIEPGMRLVAELPGEGVLAGLVTGVEHVAGGTPETRVEVEVWG